jgi:hypothetical protein
MPVSGEETRPASHSSLGSQEWTIRKTGGRRGTFSTIMACAMLASFLTGCSAASTTTAAAPTALDTPAASAPTPSSAATTATPTPTRAPAQTVHGKDSHGYTFDISFSWVPGATVVDPSQDPPGSTTILLPNSSLDMSLTNTTPGRLLKFPSNSWGGQWLVAVALYKQSKYCSLAGRSCGLIIGAVALPETVAASQTVTGDVLGGVCYHMGSQAIPSRCKVGLGVSEDSAAAIADMVVKPDQVFFMIRTTSDSGEWASVDLSGVEFLSPIGMR